MERTKVRQEQPEIKYTLKQLKSIISDRHKAFIHEYIKNGWNGTKAYQKIYQGAPDNSAAAAASNLLRTCKVRQYIDFVKNDIEMLCNISKASLSAEYKKIAFSSISHLHLKWVELEDFERLKNSNPDILDAIESIETKTEHRVVDKELVEIKMIKIKLYSKTAALEGLKKLMGYDAVTKVDITTGGESLNTPPDFSKLTNEEIKLYGQLTLKMKGFAQ